MTRGAEAPGTGIVFWPASSSSRRSSQVGPWRWITENAFARVRILTRLSSDETASSAEMNP
eukprot:4156461-Pyramimonas_sp.AAC.1